jgi:signal transduction histidine kinase
MTLLQSLGLVIAIVAIAAFIAYQLQKGAQVYREMVDDFNRNEEVKKVVDLAVELPATEEAPKPKKKRKYYPKKPKTEK